ncbi:uncharacterized protein PSFLO_01900 [Pseudozyma flocculosa]|uniref:Uncharacterized protein n=1 Tax=Pseudozyma flocculosa TaxID=84751 RepID=A0A5C3EZ45_9BASI|nr:uncharacterized protein PSFLO_01900 [Pseudozyma flocculosa]
MTWAAFRCNFRRRRLEVDYATRASPTTYFRPEPDMRTLRPFAAVATRCSRGYELVVDIMASPATALKRLAT